MKIFKTIILSLLMTFAILFVLYTLWFFWMQLFELPASYYQHYDGKGAGRCLSKAYCMGFGTKCCTFGDVVAQYFSFGIAGFFSLFKFFLVPFTIIILFSTFFINIPNLKK
ncbi:hypothetical protein ACFL3T_00335 [Patescibacteria group bacterium]